MVHSYNGQYTRLSLLGQGFDFLMHRYCIFRLKTPKEYLQQDNSDNLIDIKSLNRRFKSFTILYSVNTPIDQWSRSLPSQGRNTGSNPVGVTIPCLVCSKSHTGSAMNLTISTVCKLYVSKASYVVYVQRDGNVENLFLYSYSQWGLVGYIEAVTWALSSDGQNACFARRRSWVRVPQGPL